MGNWQLEGLPFIQKVYALTQNTDGAVAGARPCQGSYKTPMVDEGINDRRVIKSLTQTRSQEPEQ